MTLFGYAFANAAVSSLGFSPPRAIPNTKDLSTGAMASMYSSQLTFDLYARSDRTFSAISAFAEVSLSLGRCVCASTIIVILLGR